MRERKLRNCVYCQGALKQKDEKEGLHTPQSVTQLYFNGLY